MIEDFDYNEVPQNYHHCLLARCPLSADCLRFQVTRYANPGIPVLLTINPNAVAGKEENCPFFQANRQSRFALGITHLFDNLPHVKALEIKRILFEYFQRNTYYRIRSKERHIKPKEQAFIHDVFRKAGIDEAPLYDEYIYKYEWLGVYE